MINSWRDLYDIAMGLGLPGIWLWYLRDRRKIRAATRVAEGTIDADITKGEIGAFDVHMAYVERAFAAERKSLERQIAGLTGQVSDLQAEVQVLRAEVSSLRNGG